MALSNLITLGRGEREEEGWREEEGKCNIERKGERGNESGIDRKKENERMENETDN